MKNITGLEAWDLLQRVPNSYLIDVRTKEEWDTIGIPDLSSLHKTLVKITWQVGKPDFILELQEKIPSKDSKLIFICRGGMRSAAAAREALEKGYQDCYNLLDGMEGWSSLPQQKNKD